MDFSADKRKLAELSRDDSADSANCNTGYEHKDMYWNNSLVWFIIVFITIFVIVFIFIYSLQPVFVCGEHEHSDDKKYREKEVGRPVLWALGIAFVAVFLIWMLYSIA